MQGKSDCSPAKISWKGVNCKFLNVILIIEQTSFIIIRKFLRKRKYERVVRMKKLLSLCLVLILLCSAVPGALAAQQYGYINGDATLHINASKQAASVAKLTEGTKVEILSFVEEEDAFYQIKTVHGNDTGYVAEEKVDLVITREEAGIKAKDPVKRGELVSRESDYPVLKKDGYLTREELLTEENIGKYTLLEENMKDDAVLHLKDRLFTLGYITSQSDNNKYVKSTTTAIKKFQAANGLEETGIADPTTQALLYSELALTEKGKQIPAAGTLQITKGIVEKERQSGSTAVSFSLKNHGKATIDAFEMYMVPYSAYGNRVTYKDYTESLMEEMKLFTMSNETTTIKGGSTLSYQKYGYVISLPGEYYGGAKGCVISYHTTDGETVVVPDDRRIWYGVGKGVTEGESMPKVMALTPAEEEAAEAWELGVDTFYVDDEYAEIFSLREGAFVNTVENGSPAAEAGLEAGDIILAIGETRIFGQTSLARARARMAEGDSQLMLYWRNGQVYVTTLTRPGAVAL